jgi:hypothetical protein
MRRLVLMVAPALLLAGCASTQGGPGGYGRGRDAAWECQKIQSGGWGAFGTSPCNL